MSNNIILLILISFFTTLYSGTDGTIRGRVTSGDGEALIGAQVIIESLGIGAVADIDGNYILLNVPVGKYEVTVVMIGYKKYIMKNVSIIMDKTVWLNFTLDETSLEGDVVLVSAEKELVDKSSTSKKVSVSSEAIEALPIRDISELYTLQAGVVKIEGGTRGAIPDHEEQGLEEVHVRGGRTGEIAYMIDGLYIRNPIYGGIGNGTRLNLFAVQEWDWQPGGFNAEYGDALSAVSNMHTNSGGKEYQVKLRFESGGVGEMLGSEYDSLRGYDDFNFGFGGPLISDRVRFWISGQTTKEESYSVYKFDDKYYVEGDSMNVNNRGNLVQPWDNKSGFRGFGFDKTWDVFGKLTFNITKKLKTNFSYWRVAGHRKTFGIDEYGGTPFLYWNGGKNELFRDTERFTAEINHSLSSKTFYTVRASRFIQDQFQGVRWEDSDSDGYPDWFEWSNNAGEQDNFYYLGSSGYSDPYDPHIVPYTLSNVGDTVFYTKRDGYGPQARTSGWHYGATPGNYNWQTAEDWEDANRNGIYDPGESFTDRVGVGTEGVWDGPTLVEECVYRDGDYWLTPEMYVDYEDFLDLSGSEIASDYLHDPYFSYYPQNMFSYIYSDLYDSLYFFPSSGYWYEGKAFGGHDKFYGTSRALTNEIKIDVTSQINSVWRARLGLDLKSHKLNFYQVKYPWLDESAYRQRFAEQWDDYGVDGIPFLESQLQLPDDGEGNGVWDPGEAFDDFNGDGKWNDYVEPLEVSTYFQNTYEVPWFVADAGIRVDFVNYNTKIWADGDGNYSPTRPWFFQDCGKDGICPDNYYYSGPDEDNTESDGVNQGWVDQNNDGICSLPYKNDDGEIIPGDGECVTDAFGESNAVTIFRDADWFAKVSPRIGFSHIITDQSTFTFNYGVYHQTPKYQLIYLNTSSLEDPQALFSNLESSANIGNATMTAGRTQSYEFAFNVQVNRHWAYSVGAWVKKMDQLSTAKTHRSGTYEYSISSNGDYGIVKGIDLMLENRGLLINTNLQYTYSIASANGSYDTQAFSQSYVDAPSQQFLMPYDRPHDLTLTLYSSKLPYGLDASLTAMYQSGVPYTPLIKDGDKDYKYDYLNKNTKRMSSSSQVNLSLKRGIDMSDFRLSVGLNIYNLLDQRNAIDIFPLTGESDDPGSFYTKYIGLPKDGKELSSGYYDRPWFYGPPREFNFFVQFEYK